MIRDINEDAATELSKANAVLIEEVARLRARVEKLEGAMRPFGDFDCGVDGDPDEEWFRHDGDVLMAGDFQRARAALEDGE